MSPSVSFALCAVFFFGFCSQCDSFAKDDELALKEVSNLAGTEETDAEWDEDETGEDTGKFPEDDTDEFGTAQDDGVYHGETSKKMISASSLKK